MSSSWSKYDALNSPSHKRMMKPINSTVADTSYEKTQMRLERKRKQQEQIVERRYALTYGTPKEKEKY